MPLESRLRRAAALTLTLAAAILAGGCKRATPAPSLRVPHVTETFKLDGELGEPAWNAVSLRSGAFADAAGAEARPYSDARFLWGDDSLYFGLYAADDNIHTTVTAHDGPVWIDDAFTLHLTPDAPGSMAAPTYQIDISPSGVFTDVRRVPGGKDDPSWESGLQLGVDKDGTLNDPRDEDEEWVVEARLPLRSLGIDPKPGTRLLVDISRCDIPKRDKAKRCGAWGTREHPKVLELAP
jgi:hypothetical protein